MAKSIREETKYKTEVKEGLEHAVFDDKQIEEGGVKTVGGKPTEKELAMLVEEEPGIAVLISEIFNSRRTRKRGNKEDGK